MAVISSASSMSKSCLRVADGICKSVDDSGRLTVSTGRTKGRFVVLRGERSHMHGYSLHSMHRPEALAIFTSRCPSYHYLSMNSTPKDCFNLGYRNVEQLGNRLDRLSILHESDHLDVLGGEFTRHGNTLGCWLTDARLSLISR